MGATQTHLDMWHDEDDLLKRKVSIRMGKTEVRSDFERGLVVGARLAGLAPCLILGVRGQKGQTGWRL